MPVMNVVQTDERALCGRGGLVRAVAGTASPGGRPACTDDESTEGRQARFGLPGAQPSGPVAAITVSAQPIPAPSASAA